MASRRIRAHEGFAHWNGVISVHGMLGRNYGLFAHLFGARSHDEDYAPPFAGRGIPDDVSEETAYEKQGDPTPDATWFLLSEFEELKRSQEVDPERGYLRASGCACAGIPNMTCSKCAPNS